MTTAHSATPHPRASADTPVPRTVPPFAVISGAQVQHALQGREREIVDLVEATYHLHGAGDSVNPPSYFLRFPDRPASRIIALPASIGGQAPVDGLKWISSFSANVTAGIPRASAVLILNDLETGYPFACLESSIISATRTAASAALAADRLSRSRPHPRSVGFFGTGLIAPYIHAFLAGTGWEFDRIGIHDLSAESAAGFRTYLGQSSGSTPWVTVHDSAEDLIRRSDLVVFATIAGKPHVSDVSRFDHHPLVLHISLRDLAPEIVLASANSSTTSSNLGVALSLIAASKGYGFLCVTDARLWACRPACASRSGRPTDAGSTGPGAPAPGTDPTPPGGPMKRLLLRVPNCWPTLRRISPSCFPSSRMLHRAFPPPDGLGGAPHRRPRRRSHVLNGETAPHRVGRGTGPMR